MSASDSAFWRFSLTFYAREGVPPLCLALQDQQGVDVNLLFLLLFLAYQRRRLSASDVKRIDDAAATWRSRAVQPLRTLRRDLKSGVVPMDAQATEALRNDIKRCELHAERLQQEMMERAFPASSTGVVSSVQEAAAANIAAYSVLIGALPADAVHNLLRLFASAFGEQGHA